MRFAVIIGSLIVGLLCSPVRTRAQAPAPGGDSAATEAQVTARLVSSRPGLAFHLWANESRNEFEVHVLDTRVAAIPPSRRLPTDELFRVQSGAFMQNTFRPLCQAPCEIELPPREVRLAISRPGGPPILTEQPVTLRPGVEIEARYDDRTGRRAAGVVVTLLSIPFAGLTPWIAYEVGLLPGERDAAVAIALAGSGLSVLSLVIGLALAAGGDHAEVRVR